MVLLLKITFYTLLKANDWKFIGKNQKTMKLYKVLI